MTSRAGNASSRSARAGHSAFAAIVDDDASRRAPGRSAFARSSHTAMAPPGVPPVARGFLVVRVATGSDGGPEPRLALSDTYAADGGVGGRGRAFRRGRARPSILCFPEFVAGDCTSILPSERLRPEQFAFGLTEGDGTRTLGFCRRFLPPGVGPRYPLVACILTKHAWDDLFFEILARVDDRVAAAAADAAARGMIPAAPRRPPTPRTTDPMSPPSSAARAPERPRPPGRRSRSPSRGTARARRSRAFGRSPSRMPPPTARRRRRLARAAALPGRHPGRHARALRGAPPRAPRRPQRLGPPVSVRGGSRRRRDARAGEVAARVRPAPSAHSPRRPHRAGAVPRRAPEPPREGVRGASDGGSVPPRPRLGDVRALPRGPRRDADAPDARAPVGASRGQMRAAGRFDDDAVGRAFRTFMRAAFGAYARHARPRAGDANDLPESAIEAGGSGWTGTGCSRRRRRGVPARCSTSPGTRSGSRYSRGPTSRGEARRPRRRRAGASTGLRPETETKARAALFCARAGTFSREARTRSTATNRSHRRRRRGPFGGLPAPPSATRRRPRRRRDSGAGFFGRRTTRARRSPRRFARGPASAAAGAARAARATRACAEYARDRGAEAYASWPVRRTAAGRARRGAAAGGGAERVRRARYQYAGRGDAGKITREKAGAYENASDALEDGPEDDDERFLRQDGARKPLDARSFVGCLARFRERGERGGAAREGANASEEEEEEEEGEEEEDASEAHRVDSPESGSDALAGGVARCRLAEAAAAASCRSPRRETPREAPPPPPLPAWTATFDSVGRILPRRRRARTRTPPGRTRCFPSWTCSPPPSPSPAAPSATAPGGRRAPPRRPERRREDAPLPLVDVFASPSPSPAAPSATGARRLGAAARSGRRARRRARPREPRGRDAHLVALVRFEEGLDRARAVAPPARRVDIYPGNTSRTRAREPTRRLSNEA